MPPLSAELKKNGIERLDWLILLGLSLVWGSSFLLIKKGVVSFAPDEMAVLRIVITSIAFIPIYFTIGRGTIPRKKLPYAAAIGILGSGLPALLYATAETVVPSSIAGILNSLTPIFTWLVGLLFFGLVYTRNHMAGMALGLLGASIIIVLGPNFQVQLHPMMLLLVIATVSYAISGNLVQRHFNETNPFTLSSLAFFFIGIPAFLYSFRTDIYQTIAQEPSSWYSLGAIIILALLGTVAANILFYRLIQRTNVIFASSVAYLIPFMALGWGLIIGEILQWTHLVGMIFILGGVYLLRHD